MFSLQKYSQHNQLSIPRLFLTTASFNPALDSNCLIKFGPLLTFQPKQNDEKVRGKLKKLNRRLSEKVHHCRVEKIWLLFKWTEKVSIWTFGKTFGCYDIQRKDHGEQLESMAVRQKWGKDLRRTILGGRVFRRDLHFDDASKVVQARQSSVSGKQTTLIEMIQFSVHLKYFVS